MANAAGPDPVGRIKAVGVRLSLSGRLGRWPNGKASGWRPEGSGFDSRSLHQQFKGLGPEAEGYRLKLDHLRHHHARVLVLIDPSR